MNYADKKMFSRGCGLPGNYYGQSGALGKELCAHGDDDCACDPCKAKECICRRCDQQGAFDTGFALAMAYVPMQEWAGISAPCNGLCNGTVFGELVKPFCGAGRRKGV